MEVYMKISEAISIRIKEILKENNMTQYKLGQQTGLYHSTLTDILNCKYKTPNFKNIALIIRELGLIFDSKYFDFNELEID